ncbi:MAG: hypothetical protein NXI20_04885 [bacterium]|nr:hypothetical protein [bacterium]
MQFRKQSIDGPTISTWLHFFSKIAVLSIITPLVISQFSTGEIALWYLFASIQSLAHLFDLGFSSTIIRFTAYSRSVGEHWKDEIQKNYYIFNSIFGLLSILVIFFLIGVGFFVIRDIIKTYEVANGWAAYSAICVLFPLNFYFKKHDHFLKGLNKITLVNNWNSIFYLLYGAGAFVIIFVFSDFFILVAWSQTYHLLNGIKNYFLLKGVLGKLNPFKFLIQDSKLKEFWEPTWKSSLISLSSQGSVHLTSIIISAVLPVNIVASYLFTVRLLQLINEFSWAPFYSQIPNYIYHYKQGTLNTVTQSMFNRMQLSLSILIFGGVLFFIASPFLLMLIDSNVDILQIEIGIYILFALIVERLISMHSQILMFANDLRHYVVYLIASFTYVLLIQLLRLYPYILLIPASYILSTIPLIIIVFRRTMLFLRLNLRSYIANMKYVFVFIVAIIIMAICL